MKRKAGHTGATAWPASASRFTAAHAGFFDLSHSRVRPERWGESFHFYTIPSRSILQAREHGWPISFDVLVGL